MLVKRIAAYTHLSSTVYVSTNYGVSGALCSRRMGQHLSDIPCDIATLTFDLVGHGARRRYCPCTPSVYQV